MKNLDGEAFGKVKSGVATVQYGTSKMNRIALIIFSTVIIYLLPPAARASTEPAFFSPMTFAFEQNDFRAMDMGLKQTVYAQGVITSGTASRFLSFLEHYNVLPGEEIMFDSPGGLLGEGMIIGAIIRKQHLNTEVGVQGNMFGGGACYSSCTIAFLGVTCSRFCIRSNVESFPFMLDG